MKKVLTSLAVLAMFTTTYPAFAETVLPKDIAEDCDIKQSVETVITKEVMEVDTEGNFLPDKEVTRAEFLHYVLKVLNADTEIACENTFTDVKEDYKYYNDILLAKQLGLISGYENGTFAPESPITHSEATSIISHITKDKFIDCSTLSSYTDKNEIPDWAKLSYTKSLKYGVCVNDIEKSVFEPNKTLSRKESAVVLSDLIAKLAPKPEEEATPVKENVLSLEHIAYDKEFLNSTVQITNLKKVITSGNMFSVYCSDENVKNLMIDNKLKFVLPEGVKTNEGTVLFPSGTELYATVVNAKPVNLQFDTIKVGQEEYKINAKLVKPSLKSLRLNKAYAVILNEDFVIHEKI